jgi:hypothetical protein
MTDRLALAEQIRAACLQAALDAYERAGIAGLCGEGRWELAVQAIRTLDLAPLLDVPNAETRAAMAEADEIARTRRARFE